MAELFTKTDKEWLIISTIKNKQNYFVVTAEKQSKAIEAFEDKYPGIHIKKIELLKRL